MQERTTGSKYAVGKQVKTTNEKQTEQGTPLGYGDESSTWTFINTECFSCGFCNYPQITLPSQIFPAVLGRS